MYGLARPLGEILQEWADFGPHVYAIQGQGTDMDTLVPESVLLVLKLLGVATGVEGAHQAVDRALVYLRNP
jgi:hypothetical protein